MGFLVIVLHLHALWFVFFVDLLVWWSLLLFFFFFWEFMDCLSNQWMNCQSLSESDRIKNDWGEVREGKGEKNGSEYCHPNNSPKIFQLTIETSFETQEIRKEEKIIIPQLQKKKS